MGIIVADTQIHQCSLNNVRCLMYDILNIMLTLLYISGSIILANFILLKYLNFLMKKTILTSYILLTSYIKHRTSNLLQLTSYILHRTSYILYILLLTSYICNAQWYDPYKVKAKATDIYLQAIANANNSNFPVAIKMINDALKIEPKFVDAHLSVAGMYADIKNYDDMSVLNNK